MEVYLNVVEWGPGIYGAEAAARHYFHKPAAALTIGEAVRLAALPSRPSQLVTAPPNPTRSRPQRWDQFEYAGCLPALCPPSRLKGALMVKILSARQAAEALFTPKPEAAKWV